MVPHLDFIDWLLVIVFGFLFVVAALKFVLRNLVRFGFLAVVIYLIVISFEKIRYWF